MEPPVLIAFLVVWMPAIAHLGALPARIQPRLLTRTVNALPDKLKIAPEIASQHDQGR